MEAQKSELVEKSSEEPDGSLVVDRLYNFRGKGQVGSFPLLPEFHRWNLPRSLRDLFSLWLFFLIK